MEGEFRMGDDTVTVNPQYGRCSAHTALAMDVGPIQQESMFEPIFGDEAADEVRLVFIPDADGENNKTLVFELFGKVTQVRSLRTGDISVMRPEGENDRPSTVVAKSNLFPVDGRQLEVRNRFVFHLPYEITLRQLATTCRHNRC